MPLTLDHVVILVADLDTAIADYTALGFTVRRGGTHTDGATHNALIGFADGSYLELITFLQRKPEHRWAKAAERGHEGFVDFALLPGSVGAVLDRAQRRGLTYHGPLDGGRLRPDGVQLRWQIGTPTSPDLPFLCGDLTPRPLRVPEGEVRVHANGVRGVASITVAVADLDASLARYRALLGPDAASSGPPVDVAGTGLRLALLPLGEATVALASPGVDASADAALARALAARGEGIRGLVLRGPAGATRVALPLDQTHGAQIALVAG